MRRRLIILLCLLISMVSPCHLFAQPKALVYYIDNKKADLASVEAIPTGEIEESVNLAYADTKNYDAGDKDVMLVFTHQFAVNSYQQKIGAFSRDYQNYLATHKNSDKQVAYLVNGKAVIKDRGEALALFHIKNIDSVTFGSGEGKKVTVNILTKR